MKAVLQNGRIVNSENLMFTVSSVYEEGCAFMREKYKEQLTLVLTGFFIIALGILFFS